VPKQLLGKPYLNKPVRWLLSKTFSIYERWECGKLDAVVAATPFIRDEYTSMGLRSVDINNYPLLGELSSGTVDWSQKKRQVSYVGGLGHVRGIHEVVRAIGLTGTDVNFALGGSFDQPSFEAQVRAESGWQKVDYCEWLDRDGVKAALSESVAGLVTIHPIIKYLDSLPVKWLNTWPQAYLL
jgi:glycosyltransferase involved in cell wall biosynthesis